MKKYTNIQHNPATFSILLEITHSSHDTYLHVNKLFPKVLYTGKEDSQFLLSHFFTTPGALLIP